MIKTVLALTKGTSHRDHEYHIVAEIHDPANLSAARLVSGDEAVLIDKRETIAKLVVHSARQSGASVAFIELLDFKGDEIYFREDPDLVGRPFADALLAYEDCSVIGVIDAAGGVLLNPPAERPLAPGERLVAIAADDTHLSAAEPRARRGRRGRDRRRAADAERSPERILVLGWNDGAPAVIREFDEFLLAGSELVAGHRRGGRRRVRRAALRRPRQHSASSAARAARPTARPWRRSRSRASTT